MNDLELTINEIAYRRERDKLAERYPLKQFVAYNLGQIVADSQDMDELLAKVRSLGWDPMDVMVVRVGDTVPDLAIILSPMGSGERG